MYFSNSTGLFYDSVNNEIGAEMAYMEGSKMNQSAAVAKAKLLQEAETADRQSESDRPNTADDQKGEHIFSYTIVLL